MINQTSTNTIAKISSNRDSH